MNLAISTIDQRALDWFARWIALGCELELDKEGMLRMVVDGARCSQDDASEIGTMVDEVRSSPLLADGLGRVVLDYFRWKDTHDGKIKGAHV